MKANTFGSWEQTICIRVPAWAVDDVAKRLRLQPIHLVELSRATFLWERWSTKRGDDEDVVVELPRLLGNDGSQFNWEIDWSESEY